MILRWIAIIVGAGLVSAALLSPDLSRNIRFAGSFGGALVVAIALWPDLKSKAEEK